MVTLPLLALQPGALACSVADCLAASGRWELKLSAVMQGLSRRCCRACPGCFRWASSPSSVCVLSSKLDRKTLPRCWGLGGPRETGNRDTTACAWESDRPRLLRWEVRVGCRPVSVQGWPGGWGAVGAGWSRAPQPGSGRYLSRTGSDCVWADPGLYGAPCHLAWSIKGNREKRRTNTN